MGESQGDPGPLDPTERSAAPLDALLAAIPGIVWEIEGHPAESPRPRFVGAQIERILGYTLAECIAIPNFWLTTTHPDDRARAAAEAREAWEGGGRVHTVRSTHKSGRTVWLEHHVHLVRDGSGHRVGMRGVSFDVTERRAALDGLLASEARFRGVLESAPDAMLLLDTKGRIAFVNAQCEAMFGWTRDELVGQEVELLLPEDARDQHRAMRARWGALAEARTIGQAGGVHGRHRSGTLVPAEIRVSPLRMPDGELWHVADIRDVTERRRAEEALAVEKERLAVTLRSIGDAVIATDTERRVQLLNRVAEQLTGWTQDEARGRPVTEVMRVLDPATRAPVESPVDQVLRSGEAVQFGQRCVLLTRDGMERIIADSAAPIGHRGESIQGVVLAFRDVTDEDVRNAAVERASRLGALGALAGGIAHDFNNLLTTILGNLELARLGSDTARRLAAAEQSAMDARALTQRLLGFARGGAPIRRPVDLGDLLRGTTTVALAGSLSHPEFSIPADLWAAHVDAQQVSQVVRAVVENAAESMPTGGTVRVSARNEEVSGPGVLAAGRYVRIQVDDQGAGIPPELLPRVFDPFVSTRTAGAGLGLATSWAIVQRHGGHIAVTSTPGAGTSVFIHLPAADGARPEPSGQPRSTGGRVLVMDDEAVMLETMAALLSALGYDPVTTRDGQEAVTAWEEARRTGRPFCCAILDLTVPGGMGGRRAVRRIREQDPTARVIVSSGYSNDPVMANASAYGFAGVLPKPYTLDELRSVLAAVRA